MSAASCTQLIAQRARLAQLAALEPGWDSHQAAPPQEAAVTAARTLLTLLHEQEAAVAHRCALFPLDSGGVQLEWAHPSAVVSVDVAPDGHLLECLAVHASGPAAAARLTDALNTSELHLAAVFVAAHAHVRDLPCPGGAA